MAQLKKKLWQNNARVECISNQTNFRDIENPFADYSFTLQSLKKEKHQKWLVKKAEKQAQIKQQISQMEKKLDIYKKYHNKFGVSLNKT